MLKFKLLRGAHCSGRGATRRVYEKGDIIETDIELDKEFGEKFERLQGDVRVVPAPAVSEEVVVEDPYNLATMTKAELLKFAKSEGIDIPKAANKEDIIELIQQALDET